MDEYMRVYNYIYDKVLEEVLSYDNIKSQVVPLVKDEWDPSWGLGSEGAITDVEYAIRRYSCKLAEAITDSMMFYADDDLMY